MRDFKLEKSWKELLGSELKKTYMSDLRTFLVQEEKAQKTVYPQSQDILAALNLTPFDQVKVVILGQDPYHGPNQAHGLCFSVKPGVKIPPSLVNIFKELKDDLGITPPIHGCLDAWGKQGVLKGWEQFTDKIIELLNEKKENLVFILWGSPAQKKAQKVDSKKHFIIKSVHPSPLSSYRGFFGSKPFSQTNTYLNSKGIKPINWSPHE